jgi:ABC-type phosphate transport system substrate-binding protein
MNMTISRRTRFRVLIPAVSALVIMGSITRAVAAPVIAAADTVVVVVSARSSVTRISRLHLVDLYMGRTSRFPDGAPAVPIDQKPGSTVRTAFSATYLGRSEAQMKAHWSKIIFTGRGRPPAEASSGEATVNMVAGDPKAIGYIDSRLVNSSLRIVQVQ